jgi:hypothetical protein
MTDLIAQLAAADKKYDRPAVPAVYAEYVAFMQTGRYPYMDSVATEIATKHRVAADLWHPNQRFHHQAVHDFHSETGCDLLVKLHHEVYLASEEYRLAELAEMVVARLADGYERIESVDKITKFSHVVHFGFYSGGTGWQEWADARLVPQDNPSQAAVTGGIKAVLPKGKRTNGLWIHGKVLVKR